MVDIQKFQIGDRVENRTTGEVGKVVNVVWDNNHKWYDYYIRFDGRENLLRYLDTSIRKKNDKRGSH